MSFGHDRFGQVPFGTGSFADLLWDNLPRYYRDGDTEGILNKFLVASGYTMDGVKFYAERIWWLFDAFKCREDLLRQLAHNFGLETAVVWNTDFLRRFIDHIGWWLKRKGTLPAINEMLVMFGFADIEALELFDIESIVATDPVDHPDYYVLRYGDLAFPLGPGQNDPTYGVNKFFHGSWKHTYGSMGWFTEAEASARSGTTGVLDEEQTTVPPWGSGFVFVGTVAHTPVVPRTFFLYVAPTGVFVALDDGSGHLRGPWLDPAGVNTINYATGEWHIQFLTIPAEWLGTPHANYRYGAGAREAYPLSFLKFVSNATLTTDELLAIQAAVAVCLPRHVGVVRLEIPTGT